MKINMYMYDRQIELGEDATKEFLIQYDRAKDMMHHLLGLFDDEDTRVAMFYMMSLRTLMDDFIEFCTNGIDVDLMESLLNNEIDEEEIFEDLYEEEEDDSEILVEFDDDEEE